MRRSNAVTGVACGRRQNWPIKPSRHGFISNWTCRYPRHTTTRKNRHTTTARGLLTSTTGGAVSMYRRSCSSWLMPDTTAADLRWHRTRGWTTGFFNVRIFRNFSKRELLRHFWSISRRRYCYSPKIDTFTANEVMITAEADLPFHVDGYQVGRLPLRLRTLPLALKVIA